MEADRNEGGELNKKGGKFMVKRGGRGGRRDMKRIRKEKGGREGQELIQEEDG